MGFLKDTEGATSVLVVFMMIVLVTFGAFAITSANVNLKLSRAALDWNGRYYAMDAEAQEILFDVDQAVADAAANSVNAADFDANVSDALEWAFMLGDVSVDYAERLVRYTVSDDMYNLSVTARVNEPGAVPRIDVTEWREWQKPKPAEAPPVWDGSIPVD